MLSTFRTTSPGCQTRNPRRKESRRPATPSDQQSADKAERPHPVERGVESPTGDPPGHQTSYESRRNRQEDSGPKDRQHLTTEDCVNHVIASARIFTAAPLVSHSSKTPVFRPFSLITLDTPCCPKFRKRVPLPKSSKRRMSRCASPAFFIWDVTTNHDN